MIVLGVVAISGWLYTQREQIQNTENKNREFIENAFPKSLISLSIDSHGAHFKIRPDGRKFVVGDPRTVENYRFNFDFSVSDVGQIFFTPDHHGCVTYTVKEIRNDRIVLHYVTNFDLRSFGKNIRGSDTGDFTVYPTEATKK